MTSYTVTTVDTRASGDPFEVMVRDDRHLPVAQLSAMSAAHARMVASAIVLLLPKLDPQNSVVVDVLTVRGASGFSDRISA